MRLFVYSVPGDNILLLSHFWWRETIPEGQKISYYFVGNCLKNFCLLSVSWQMHESFENGLMFKGNGNGKEMALEIINSAESLNFSG